jgi:hypothetical protein
LRGPLRRTFASGGGVPWLHGIVGRPGQPPSGAGRGSTSDLLPRIPLYSARAWAPRSTRPKVLRYCSPSTSRFEPWRPRAGGGRPARGRHRQATRCARLTTAARSGGHRPSTGRPCRPVTRAGTRSGTEHVLSLSPRGVPPRPARPVSFNLRPPGRQTPSGRRPHLRKGHRRPRTPPTAKANQAGRPAARPGHDRARPAGPAALIARSAGRVSRPLAGSSGDGSEASGQGPEQAQAPVLAGVVLGPLHGHGRAARPAWPARPP